METKRPELSGGEMKIDVTAAGAAAAGLASAFGAGIVLHVYTDGSWQLDADQALKLIVACFATIAALLFFARRMLADDGSVEPLTERDKWIPRASFELNLPDPPAIDDKNFRVDSTGWKELEIPDGSIVIVKTNPEGDAWELLEGKYAGEQQFTLEAALRETAKAGKRMPTREEWLAIVRSRYPHVLPEMEWWVCTDVARALGLPLVWNWISEGALLRYEKHCGRYWCSVPDSVNEPFVRTKCGFSVRCLKE